MLGILCSEIIALSRLYLLGIILEFFSHKTLKILILLQHVLILICFASISVCNCLPVCVPVYLSTYQFISVCPCVCARLCESMCLSVCLSICLSVCLSVHVCEC